jgi:NADPH-dependent 2,4-dienoyl-CoA reductase/sulfur reductase-like enzyme
MLPQVLPNFDADMAGLVVEELERQGVAVFTAHRVEGFEGDGQVRQVVAASQTFPADIVLLAVGVKPHVALPREAGIALGPTGAVAVDDHMRTNIPHVYAAGDVAEAIHLVTGQPAYIPLGTTANKQGRVAGENAARGDATFRGVVGTAVVKVFDLEAARTGLTEREAREQGYGVQAVKTQHGTRAHYYPGGSPLHVKLVVEGSGKLLGAQMIGREGAAKRIDVLATALQAEWSVEELSRLDLSYAPPFSPVWDPILVAANVALR